MTTTTTADEGGTTVHLYPKAVRDGLSPPPPHSRSHPSKEIDAICRALHESCKEGMGGDERRGRVLRKIGKGTGWGVDDHRIVQSLAPATGEERHLISKRYKQLYREELTESFERNLSGDFGLAVQLLGSSPPEADCRLVRRACDGLGADETLLYSVLCGRSNADMETLKRTYFKLNGEDLGKLLIKELSGDLEKLLFTSVQATEETYDPEGAHAADNARSYADRLHRRAREGNWFGADGVHPLVCAASPPFLVQVDAIYRAEYGHGIFYEFYRSRDVSPVCKRAAIFSVGMKTKPAETVAKLIKTACAGLGTDETLLTSCVVRYRPMLREAALAHLELYEKTLTERIRSETSGRYKAVLLAVLDGAFPEDAEGAGAASGFRSCLLGSGKVRPSRKGSSKQG